MEAQQYTVYGAVIWRESTQGTSWFVQELHTITTDENRKRHCRMHLGRRYKQTSL